LVIELFITQRPERETGHHLEASTRGSCLSADWFSDL
jgi:hypothetical protein